MMRVLLALGLFLAAFGGILWAASNALSRASERVVVYQYIADAFDVLEFRDHQVNWRPATVPLTRPFTESDAALIGRAMGDAWSALAIAQTTGRADLLSDGFSGVAQERAEQAVRDAVHGGRMVVLAQTAKPLFYHLDGSVFQAEVTLLVARFMVDDRAEDAADDMVDDAVYNTGLTYFELVEDRAITTLMNESNGWRIYAHERLGAVPVTPPLPAQGWDGPPLVGLNYYPALTPWKVFWPDFNADIIGADFERMAGLNANAVRVFLTAETFTDPETRPKGITDLKRLLSIAEATGVQLVPTLFDLKPSFDPAGWGEDLTYLQTVLPILAESPAVAFVDLKNEPDLDFEAYGQGTILAWLHTMLRLARLQAPDLAYTVGWSSAEAAPLLAQDLDLVTYHDYADIRTATQRLEAVRAATDRPVMVTEIGVSSYSAFLSFPGSPKAQAVDLSDRIDALAAADGIFTWTLYDFPNVDAAAVGGSPWVKRLQGHFGLFTAEGTEKPAAAIVREAFAARRAPDP